MVEELVFTSAKRGLEVGKSGFCTVASSTGMAANLARLLRSLSGYRHLHAPGTPAAASNPVAYAHLKTKVGGKEFSILSRICDADIDYSNRSNKLAHHFAIDRTKRPQLTPVEILANESQFYCHWDEDPKKLPPRTLAGQTLPTGPCATWGSTVGDSGWAGDLAEAVIDKRPVYLIVNEQTPALQLIIEALSLLPRQQQWNVTFSTFFTKLPPSVECAVRCVIAGSPEVGLARRSQKNLVLDLTTNLGTSESSYADAARNGTLIGVGGATASGDLGLAGEEKPSEEDCDYELTMADSYELKEVDTPSAQLSGRPPAAPPKLGRKPKAPTLASPKTQSRIGLKIGIAAAAIAMLLGLGAAVFFAVQQTATTGQVAESTTDNGEDAASNKAEPEAIETEAIEPEPPAPEPPAPEPPAPEPPETETPETEPPETETPETETPETEPPKPKPPAPAKPKPPKELTPADIVSTKLPNEENFASFFESEKQIAKINKAISLPDAVISNTKEIAFDKQEPQESSCVWTIKDADETYGEIRLEVNESKTTSTLYLKVTNFRASPAKRNAIRSGFKLNAIEVRAVTERCPRPIYASISPNFKLDVLDFKLAMPVQPAFTAETANWLKNQLNRIFKGKGNSDSIELDCKCDTPLTLSIVGFENPDIATVVIKIRRAEEEGSFELGLEGDDSLAKIIEAALLQEKQFLTNQLDTIERDIKKNRKNLKEEFENEPAGLGRKQLGKKIQSLPDKDFKWNPNQPTEHYNKTTDEGIETLAVIDTMKQKRQNAIATSRLNLENGDFRGIVLPIANKSNPKNPSRFYVVFGNTPEEEEAQKAIKNWEETNRGDSDAE